MFLRFLLTAALVLSISSAAWGQDLRAIDEERRLDSITVPGTQFDLNFDIPEGKMIFSPQLVVNINGEKGRSAIHDYYELVFDPVIVLDNGFVVPDPDPRRKRKRMRPFLKNTLSSRGTGSNINRSTPDKYTLTFKEGTYALTNVEYLAETTISARDVTSAFQGGLLPISFETINYCLAEGTLIFSVKAGETVDFGDVLFRGIYRKPYRSIYTHMPIAASASPATRPADGAFFNVAPDPAAWGVARFDDDVGLCRQKPAGGRLFVTSGWPISDSWEW